jgi:molybdopterin-containing oxidoreductase family iron-sulfur binding subunit
MGRPTKIEGNPSHPANLGATVFSAQASILTLYDPDRSQVVAERTDQQLGKLPGTVSTERNGLLARKGGGFAILTETITSPTLAEQIKRLLAELPEAKWHQWSR